ncbi:hypothetical protein H8356DRAFT_1006356 [Neocallimastix lanati (nom. inval.)]|jgi:hypothetical protein|uniref:Uncharacterized protein n=1 Tax=Neocallimastix californiae TaxID=1754190 RepID=A0A1Y2DAG1_9FUNG|nr:hypothetical protein H8356DRAFT_1006356 [Neocallimastix sp. JGI-2020a]ORY56249.1 hypothetical protein LY90DRAFT_701840 [Neocallimastix californiae]|eukprot:ORY56249.1 hypothetical protein LY90DRAFT_701840 [Neocallimastix californiae]
MGKQNTPLILGFVNNAARNTFNVSQKQVQNKNGQQKAMKQQKTQTWTFVNNSKTSTKGFQSWADAASRNTKSELQNQYEWSKPIKSQQQRNKAVQQKPKQVQKQQPQKHQQEKMNSRTQQPQTQSWGWYPASKHQAELKKLNQKANKKMQQGKQQQGKQQQRKPQSKQQKMRMAAMISNKTKREAEEFRRAQEQKKDFALLKNINTVYDGFSYTFPLQNNRNAWISTNKVGGNKVMSVATLFAIKYAPTVRGNKKPFVQRNGVIIFNNKCIRRAVEGRFTGHKKFRGNRVLTYIPEKWLSKENSYDMGTRYEKYTNLNEPKRNERCYSFKGVY